MRWKPIFRRWKNSIPLPDRHQRRQRLSHRAGRLRQVLYLLRGALHPRLRTIAPAAAILREARQLADKGAREIVLLGQNVNAYDCEAGPGQAVRAHRRNRRHRRIRYTTSHPRDMGDDLIAAHGEIPS
jgi:hypothetical protein